jgi:hypothetical protein
VDPVSEQDWNDLAELVDPADRPEYPPMIMVSLRPVDGIGGGWSTVALQPGVTTRVASVGVVYDAASGRTQVMEVTYEIRASAVN